MYILYILNIYMIYDIYKSIYDTFRLYTIYHNIDKQISKDEQVVDTPLLNLATIQFGGIKYRYSEHVFIQNLP